MPDIFSISLADLTVKIKSKYVFTKKLCNEYLTDNHNVPDIYAESNDDDIIKEKTAVPTADTGVCESLCIYRAVAEQLPEFDRFVFHGAAIEYENNALLFTAPSGTGKTTHIYLWKKHLGDKVDIINGDKPIISVKDCVTVYGTPWCGKEGLNRNVSAPLKAICVLKQSKVNCIKPLDNKSAINHLMRQVYLPKGEIASSKTLELLGKLIEKTPIYMLECDISEQAFKTAFEQIC